MTDPRAVGLTAGEVLSTFDAPVGDKTVHVIADPQTPSGLNYVLTDAGGAITDRPETDAAQNVDPDDLETDPDGVGETEVGP